MRFRHFGIHAHFAVVLIVLVLFVAEVLLTREASGLGVELRRADAT